MNTIERIEQAFLQLTFAIKLMTHIELGRVDEELLDTHVLVKSKKRNVSFPANAFRTRDDIILAGAE